VFERQAVKVKGLDTSDLLKWLDGLKGRFKELARWGLFVEQYPKQLVFAGFNQDKEGVGLSLVRGDGDKLEVIIPYEQVTEFLLHFLSEAGKAAKIKPEEMEQLRNTIDSLMAMMGKAVKND
jgi:hypothetical protein